MKFFLLFFYLATASSLVLAQTTTWSININPTVSYRIAPVPTGSSLTETVQSGEKAIHTFDFGLDIRTQLNDRFSLGAGLFYSKKGVSNTLAAVVYDQPGLPTAYVIDFTQDYLDIPIFITYTLAQQKKLDWYALAGINNSLLLHEKNEIGVRSTEFSVRDIPLATRELLSQPYLRAAQSYGLGLIGGGGVRAQVDDRTFLGLEAIGKVMLTPLKDIASDSERRTYSLGLNFRFIRTLW